MEKYIDLIPCITIHPNKICLYKEVHRSHPKTTYVDQFSNESEPVVANELFLKSARKNNGYMSDHAKRKLFKAIDYLLLMSERKKIYSKVQRKYITYRIVFVTLTLPSKQVHSDKEITNKCLNQLFIELNKYHNVQRYIWRAEKQENGNIHYHILINQFIEYSDLRKRWNRICNKLGYVDSYQANMKDFYKNGFRMSNNLNDKRTKEDQQKAFILGQKSNWTSPNSTDIHNTRKIRNIKAYVSKYLSKQPSITPEEYEQDSSNQLVNGRLWSCSQDLSKIEGCKLTEDWQISDELEKVATNSHCKFFIKPYFSVLFIDWQKLRKYGSDLLMKLFAEYIYDHFNYSLQLKLV